MRITPGEVFAGMAAFGLGLIILVLTLRRRLPFWVRTYWMEPGPDRDRFDYVMGIYAGCLFMLVGSLILLKVLHII